MPTIKKTLIALLFATTILIVPVASKAQIPDQIILSLKTGNAKVLSNYFNQNVELVVLDNDNVYSKAQAQQIVNNFFTTHKPEDFISIHDGGKEGAKYVIGNLVTKNGNFRVYFLLKQNQGKDYIHQLRIETEKQ